MADIREYLSRREIALRLGVTKSRVIQIARARGIEGVHIGHQIVFHESQLPRFALRPPGRPRDAE